MKPMLMFLLLVAVAGCGQYDAHVFAAATARDAVNQANTQIRADRMDSMRAAGRTAEAQHADVGAAIEAAAAQYDTEHAQLIAAQQTLAHAVQAYVAGVWSAIRGESADLATLAAELASTWGAFTHLIDEPALDIIPPEVLTFLSGGHDERREQDSSNDHP